MMDIHQQAWRAETFLAAFPAADNDALTRAIAHFCADGWGFIITPDTQGPRLTHLFEITLFDIAATGETLPQAVANWRTVATRIIDAAAEAAAA